MAVQNTPGDGDVNVVQFRIERGAEAMATDGRIGIVEQIVVDRTNGQLLSLVLRGEETNTEFEMPASHVLRATGDHVYLDVSRADLMNHPEMTNPYDPEQYVPVYQGDAMPASVASQTAAQQETPVITDVEENAAELVAPEMTAAQPASPTRRTDERVTTATGPATGETTWTPRGDGLADTDTTPTVKLSRAGGAGEAPAGWDEAVGSEERPVPTPEPSVTPETTGPLMGGKPSTGGMGTAASVPHETAPALDTVPTSPNLPPYTTEHPTGAQPPTPNLVNGDEPDTMKGAARNPAPATDPQLESLAAPSPMSALPPMSAEELLPAPSPQLMTTPSRQLANLRDHLPDLLLNMAKSPEVWILAGSLGAGIIGGILFRRDLSRGTTPSPTARQAKRAAGSALDRAQDRLQDAQDRLASKTGDVAQTAKAAQSRLAEKAGDAAKNTGRNAQRTAGRPRRAAKRAARRGRWFRRGLVLGGTGAMLFAPQRGEQTRAQLKTTWEQLRARIA